MQKMLGRKKWLGGERKTNGWNVNVDGNGFGVNWDESELD